MASTALIDAGHDRVDRVQTAAQPSISLSVGDGVSGVDISTITGSDGTKQVTVDGHPLCYIADAIKAGQTNREATGLRCCALYGWSSRRASR